MNTEQRAAFEGAATALGYDVTPAKGEYADYQRYSSLATEALQQGWQAAHSAQPVSAGLAEDPAATFSWRAGGEANFYTAMRGKNWHSVIQMNGEMTVQQQEDAMSLIVGSLSAAQRDSQPAEPAGTAEDYLRGRYGAYRGHFAWRELEEAFNAGKASTNQPVADTSADARDSALMMTISQITGKYQSMPPENGESWESWYGAAFDMLSGEISAAIAASREIK